MSIESIKTSMANAVMKRAVRREITRLRFAVEMAEDAANTRGTGQLSPSQVETIAKLQVETGQKILDGHGAASLAYYIDEAQADGCLLPEAEIVLRRRLNHGLENGAVRKS